MPRQLNCPDHLVSLLPPAAHCMVSGCSAESALVAEALAVAGPKLGGLTVSGVFLPGVNRRTWPTGPDGQVMTFFQTPELAREGARVTVLSLCYQDILASYRAAQPAAVFVTCSPPNRDGWCSLGTEVGFIGDLWRTTPIRIAHINARMPATRGDPGIPFDALTGWFEGETALLTGDSGPVSYTVETIARTVAAQVGDGATLQTGIGRIPDAVLGALCDRRGLRLHTGVISDGVLALVDAGALAPGAAVVTGVALGSAALYQRITEPWAEFHPVSVTHDPHRLAGRRGFVSINSAMAVDLFGQAYAEASGGGLLSGPGGASDFARAARLNGGLRIVALAASANAGAVSRIVAPGAGHGPVSLGRMDIDLVVTENGIADLRGTSYQARAERLIEIAAPSHRAALTDAWRALWARLSPPLNSSWAVREPSRQ
jgi:acyl-CoA hydrolase